MADEVDWRIAAAAATAVGVVIGAGMADRRRRQRIARHRRWRRAALKQARSREGRSHVGRCQEEATEAASAILSRGP
jgi:hypothetical protein